MKNLYNKSIRLVLSLVIVLGIAACEEDTHFYDGPSLVHFPNPSTSATTYFVNQTNDEGFTILVGVTAASNQDRTFNVIVDAEKSTAEAGTHYTMPATVTIPANEVVGELKVQGLFQNLEDPEVLAITLSPDQNNASFYQTYSVTLRQFCPFERVDFIGTFSFTSTLFGTTKDVELVAGNAPNEVIAKNLFSNGADITIVLNDSDPTYFVGSIPVQNAWVSSLYGQMTVQTRAPHGRFSACETTISLPISHCIAGTNSCYATDNATFRKL